MKKKLILASTIAASSIAVISPISLTSCSNINHKYDDLTKEIKQQAINEFVELSKIYRETYNTRKICDYLKDRIPKINSTVSNLHEDGYRANWVDETLDPDKSSGNIWFDLPANNAQLAENPMIAIQAHMDMVCVASTPEDLEKMKTSGVEVEVNEKKDIITSKDMKTSLGADNGIGVAIILAMLANKEWQHGPIRFIITADEEEGMAGAGYLGYEHKDDEGPAINVVSPCKTVLNIDDELVGQIITSTAGGFGSEFVYALPDTKITLNNLYTITVDKLLGGHSGDFIGFGRANGIKVVNDILYKISNLHNVQLISFTSPNSTATNAIVNKAVVIFGTDCPKETIQKYIDEELTILNEQYYGENDPTIALEPFMIPAGLTVDINAYNTDESRSIIELINGLIYGVVTWKDSSRLRPETSGNIGPISLGWYPDATGQWWNHSFSIKAYDRSCNNTHLKMFNIYNLGLEVAARESGFLMTYLPGSLYYGWPGDDDEAYIKFVANSFRSFGTKPTYDDPHAGLEISWFKHFNPDTYTTSIGPTILDVHTTKETLYLDTLDPIIKVALASIDNMQNLKSKGE